MITQQAIKFVALAERLKQRKAKPPEIKRPAIQLPSVELSTTNINTPVTIPRLAIAMVTTDRRVPTIYATLKSVRRAGFQQHIHIFSQAKNLDERMLYLQDANITIYDTSHTSGGSINWKIAVTFLSQRPVDWVMTLEDDIAWCRAGASVLYHTLNQIDAGNAGIRRHRIGLLSAYTSPGMIVSSANRSGGWTEAHFCGATKGLWGALALCMPKEVVQLLLQHASIDTPKYGIDYIIGNILRSRLEPPLEVKVHIPSLVEHTGEHSTIFTDEALAAPGIYTLRHGYKFNDNYNRHPYVKTYSDTRTTNNR